MIIIIAAVLTVLAVVATPSPHRFMLRQTGPLPAVNVP
jgi:hypothetical protein